MGIQYNWTDKRADESDITFPYKDWQIIEPAIESLKSRTGIYIDPYADTRLSNDHAVLLRKLIAENVNNPSPEITKLCGMLAESGQTGRWLLFLGD
ncbi:MAG: hypothetical protein ABJO01_04455 [Parasphingorhabdus sp.]|uniref:hypothetical protein n=1 Tax=Parasphingorhabdus sp. TaxID=2709688 RepID=UPI0032994C42